jgi:mono/diheme cytochrome c family protein
MRSAYLLALALGLAACQPQAQAGRPPAAVTPPSGLALAQGACGGCHALEPHRASPNPQAPAFSAIVNQGGLTDETLGSWLRDAHNYPEEMEFTLDAGEVDQLVAFMLTLRDPGFRSAN